MPSLYPDNRFLHFATFSHQDGDIVYVNIRGVRVYDASVTFVTNVPFKEALQYGHGFCGAMEIFEDFLTFAQVVANLPLVVPKNTQIPIAEFMNSPFADVEYYTFTDNYYFVGVSQKPQLHIDTEYYFPLTLAAFLVIDAQFRYSKNPFGLRPAVPENKERRVFNNGWACDFPFEETYEYTETSTLLFRRNTGGFAFSYDMYTDANWLYKDILYTEEAQTYICWFGAGMKTDPLTGRMYYYGTDQQPQDPNYPYKSIEPIPPSSLRHKTTVAFNALNGFLKNRVSSLTLDIYPPEGARSHFPTLFVGKPGEGIGLIVLIGGINLSIVGLRIDTSNVEGDAMQIGNAWRIGFDALTIGGNLWQ